jgi:hypothetical protein
MATAAYRVFGDKVLLKWNRDLLELHKRVLTTYLVSKGIKASTRKKFFIIYDMDVTEDNIKAIFYKPTDLVVKALVMDRIKDIIDIL